MIKIEQYITARTRVWVISGLILIFIFSVFTYSDVIVSYLSTLVMLLMPVIVAYFMAFLLMPFRNLVIKHLFKKIFKTKRVQYTLASLVVLMVVFLVFSAFLFIVIPQLIQSISTLINSLPTFFNQLEGVINNFQIEFNIEQELSQLLQNSIIWIESNFELLLENISLILNGLWVTVLNVTWNLALFVMALMVFLIDFDHLANAFRRLTFALFSKDFSKKLVKLSTMVAEVFRGYFVGQALDSFIMGAAMFGVLSILGFPYALLIGIIIMVTNMIPFFGPFLGAIPSALILMTVDFSLAVQFVIIITIAQQIDGNILAPYILGDSLKLPSLFILVAITVFGGLFGLPGMFFGVPVFAVIYRLIKYWMNNRLEKI